MEMEGREFQRRVAVSINRSTGTESHEMPSEVDMRHLGAAGGNGVERDLVRSWGSWLLEYDWVPATRAQVKPLHEEQHQLDFL